MQTLKSLTLAAIPKRALNDPIMIRRTKLVTRLQEQKALLADPTFVVMDERWETTPEGRRERVAYKRKVHRWWREEATGSAYLMIRYGQKVVEIEKGKPAIVVSSKAGLDEVLNTLISAVQLGELDDALAAAAKARVAKKRPATS